MHCYTAVLFLCAFIAQAACSPVREDEKASALNRTIQAIRNETTTALKMLDDGPVPDKPCVSLNLADLSSFRCYLMEVSPKVLEVSHVLNRTSQYILNVERAVSSGASIGNRNCSLPVFKQELDTYVFARCLLRDLVQWLRTAKFNVTA